MILTTNTNNLLDEMDIPCLATLPIQVQDQKGPDVRHSFWKHLKGNPPELASHLGQIV